MTTEEIRQKAALYVEKETNPVFRAEVENLLKTQGDAELSDRFYTSLSFGTGGLRGVIGGGTNRMNPYMVRSATQGLANYVNSAVPSGASAVIAHDCRRYSDLFALEAALVLCANGIKTFLFPELRPTPVLSFAVRHLKATTGIVVTASHNPPEYNGYKVYWNDGAQVLPPHDEGIIAEVQKTQGFSQTMTKEEALAKGLLVYIKDEIDIPYQTMVKAQALRKELFQKEGKNLKVVYTPLHGTGGTELPIIMKDLGVNLTLVPEQAIYDGNFPTVTSPNPEEKSAMDMGLSLAAKINADLLLGTDPDADRLGIGVPSAQGWLLLNGNQLGALLADYLFMTLKEQGKMPAHPVFINSIVTTELHHLIAAKYGVKSYKVLTGFKYVGEKIREFETSNSGETYLFGTEESYGFLVGTSVRDKDAMSAAALTIEMALYHRSQGRTVLQALNALYEELGYFQEIQISKTFKGQTGLEKMKSFMTRLSQQPPQSVGGLKLAKMINFNDGTSSFPDGTKKKTETLAASNVLQFFLEDGSLVTVRPSGTEPKIKFYASCRAQAGQKLADAEKVVSQKVTAIRTELDKWID